jgi:glucose/arabinose dehydrogenase
VKKESDAHNGGQVAIGPDGRLYVGIGDDAEPREHPQSLEPGDLLGKIVRLDPGAAAPRPRIVAYGLRNPWRFSFDRATGELWVADVGELGWEEVTRLPRARGAPPNLGWPGYEGHEAITWDGDHEEPQGPGRLTWPITVYAREAGCAAVIGGHVYRGRAIPALRGRYLYGDFCTGTVWSLDPARPGEVRTELELGATLASFGEDAAGELYLVSRTGTLFRLSG